MTWILKMMHTLGLLFALHPVATFFAALVVWGIFMAAGTLLFFLFAR